MNSENLKFIVETLEKHIKASARFESIGDAQSFGIKELRTEKDRMLRTQFEVIREKNEVKAKLAIIELAFQKFKSTKNYQDADVILEFMDAVESVFQPDPNAVPF